jgi:hypothetical protein
LNYWPITAIPQGCSGSLGFARCHQLLVHRAFDFRWRVVAGGHLDDGACANRDNDGGSGLFSVLSWDSTFPDRRDILVLGPLPIPPRLLFVAKLTALVAALGLSVFALNVFTGLVWPLVFFPATNGVVASARSLAAYWMTMLAASAFIFVRYCACNGRPRNCCRARYFCVCRLSCRPLSFVSSSAYFFWSLPLKRSAL